MRAWRAAAIASLVVGGWVGGGVRPASAHHVPGHAASEGVRNLNTMGGRTGSAGTRVMLLQEFARDTRSLNPGTTSISSVLGEYAPHPWFSFGLQFPLLVVDEDAPGVAPKIGYGDTRLQLRFTPHADKLIHRVLTVGLAASFPTRTLQFEADPGRIWSVSPSIVFTRTYMRPFWQLLGVASIEHRPAGTAVDLSAGARVGYRLLNNKLTPTFGMIVDVRAANFCAQPGGGSEFCTGNRSTEVEREVGSVRASQVISLGYSFAKWGMIAANVQVPVTPKRDFDVAGSLNFQVQF